jgi:hypothetical protein
VLVTGSAAADRAGPAWLDDRPGMEGESGLESDQPLHRWDLAVHLWAAIEHLPEHLPNIPAT